MLQVDYPPTDLILDFTQVFTIQADDNFDTVFLGSIESGYLVGYVGFSGNKFQFRMVDNSIEFPQRNSYEEIFFDIFRLIANDPDFAQEFAVIATRKFMLDTPADY
jgi:hypothetical protein